MTAKDKTAQKLNLTQDAAISSGELANGLKYYVKENKQPANSAYFYLVVSIGSTDERENELGLAHFTEHMAFNGSREFSKNELVKKLESLGVAFGADLNAQTSYDQTSYLLEIHVNEQNLKDVFRVFRDWIDGVSFDAAELDKERGIIVEEGRARNTPAYRFYIKNRVPELYGESIYAKRSPIGDMNIVKNNSGYHVIFNMNSDKDAEDTSKLIGDYTNIKISKLFIIKLIKPLIILLHINL